MEIEVATTPPNLKQLEDCIADVSAAIANGLKVKQSGGDSLRRAFHGKAVDSQSGKSYLRLFAKAFESGFGFGSEAKVVSDLAEGAAQRMSGNQRPIEALQAAVNDLYDGFLSEEDRQGKARSRENNILPPMVKWGSAEKGPYVWSSKETAKFGLPFGLINFPKSFEKQGLLAWASLAHEVCGHDILHANPRLLGDLWARVVWAFAEMPYRTAWRQYFKDRFEEAISDILGIINMGPAAAIGLIVTLKGRNQAILKTKHLLTYEIQPDHPSDALRGYIAAATVERLASGSGWDKALWNLVDEDVASQVKANGKAMKAKLRKQGPLMDAMNAEPDHLRTAAKIFVNAILDASLESLRLPSSPIPDAAGNIGSQGRKAPTLLDLQDWTEQDDEIAGIYAELLQQENFTVPESFDPDHYATHVMAGAILGALAQGEPKKIQKNMVDVLAVLRHRSTLQAATEYTRSL